jgi:TolB-like protein
MRVNVQLVEAESANHLWAERFDKPVGVSGILCARPV